LVGPFARVIGGLSAGQRIALLVLTGSIIAGFIAVGFWVRQPDFQLLYGNVPSDGASKIIEALKDQRIPYKVANGGRDILVPANNVYETRIALAGEGLPQGGQVGFELFDQSRLGMGRFTQQIYFQRALEGELSRTISSMEGVEKARVHLVLKDQSVFADRESQPSASVALGLRSGRNMGRQQIQSVVHLVAGSVMGLAPDRVVVVDHKGTLLSGGEKEAGGGLVSASQFEQQHQLETQVEKKIQNMLERALGPNKAVVRVSMEMDFKKVEQTEEKYDPESIAIRSEQRTTESSKKPGQGGDAQQAASGAAATSTKQQETINYEVNKLIRRMVEPSGKVQRLSVAVMVDGRYESPAGGGEPEYVPRTDEELKTYEGLVKEAVGFDTARGDRVTVVNVAFRHPEEDISTEAAGAMEKMMNRRFWISAAQKLLFVILVPLLLLFMVLRPLLKWVTSASPEVTGSRPYQLPRTVEQMETEMGLLPGATGEPELKLRALELAKSDPNRAAQLAKSWLNE
jgi:flagellar M-ring protein FliF